MHTRLPARSLVRLALVAAVVGAGLTTAGSGIAAAAETPRAATMSATGGVTTQAVVNLGLDRRQARAVQEWLAAHHGYRGSIDGYLGTGSWQAFQRHLRAHGYNGAIDGVVGSGTVKALQRKLSHDSWDYNGAIDGIAGVGTKAAFERFAQGLLCEPCTTR
ncbi:peptidoglycan-binding protein [Streptomyces sp. NPDC051214]|uniref:peptidoglycan-binding protein n=1 Tax=Streptomyces sp. NPDC051214 TaxID=3155282 RepID=UPI003413BAC3